MNVQHVTIALLAAIGAALSGCSSLQGAPTTTSMPAAGADTGQEQTIARQQSQIDQLERDLRARDQASATASGAATVASASGPTDLFPPDAAPGRCYARILVPASYQNEQERVLAREASQRVEIIPARYETATESVLIKEASSRLEVIPARYETRTESVLVRPESTRIEAIPATYRTVTEQVLISPARTEWKRGPASSFGGTGAVLRTTSTDTGEIMCLVEVPAQYDTITRTVVDQRATTREISVPAEYRTIETAVLVTPAATREIEIPAEYTTVEVTNLAQPASERVIDIPAEYTMVTKRTKAGEDMLEWREVVCDVNLTASNIRSLQTALRDDGHYAGPIDGILGSQTLAGANAFADSQGLPTGSNYIAATVAEQLGLSFD